MSECPKTNMSIIVYFCDPNRALGCLDWIPNLYRLLTAVRATADQTGLVQNDEQAKPLLADISWGGVCLQLFDSHLVQA